MSTPTFQKGDRVHIGPEADFSLTGGTVVSHRGQQGTVVVGTPDDEGDILVAPDSSDDPFAEEGLYVLPEHLTLIRPDDGVQAPAFTTATVREAIAALGLEVVEGADDADDEAWDHVTTYALGLVERAKLEGGR